MRESSPFAEVARRHARAKRDGAVLLETVKNYNVLISARYVLFLMIKFRPTSSYYIIQEEQLYTTKGYKICLSLSKCLNYESFPKYLKDMLTLRQSVYSSRRTNILSLCKPATTTYGLNSFRYFASKKWNSLPNVRSEPTLSGFRRLLKAVSFQT